MTKLTKFFNVSLSKLLILTAIVAVASATNYLYAQWQNPPANPPNQNTPTPINVGGDAQDKSGVLGVGGLGVFGKVRIEDGTQADGYVLSSDATGIASWKDPATLGITGGGGSSTLLPGWPDAIRCDSASENIYLYLWRTESNGDVLYWDNYDHGGLDRGLRFGSSKNFKDVLIGGPDSSFNCANKSISQLDADGLTFYFSGTNSSGGSTSSGKPIIDQYVDAGVPVAPITVNGGLDKWPDFFICKNADAGEGEIVMQLNDVNDVSGVPNEVQYRSGSDNDAYMFNADGSYKSMAGGNSVQRGCGLGSSNDDIVSICNNNRCGFYGGGGASSAAPLPSCGNGEILSYDDGTGTWECSAPAVGSACQLERTYVASPDGVGPWAYSDGRDKCFDLMTQDALDDGWIPTGSDACAEDGDTCRRDGIVCHYARLTCGGAPIPTTFRQYDSPDDALFDNFWNQGN